MTTKKKEITLDEQIAWVEREAKYMDMMYNQGTQADDGPTVRAILASLNKLKQLEK